MTMNRSLVRWAAVNALNNFLSEPWPTIAGPNIFDSKIEPVEDMQPNRPFPCCVVYTDYDKDPWLKGGKGNSPRVVTITLELLVVMTEAPGGEDQPYQLSCPATDDEIEFSLDVFETQIYRALAASNEATDAFNYLVPTYESLVSRRGASVEGGQRLAARQITIEAPCPRDPIAGVIPANVEPFLARLEAGEQYAERAAELRVLATANASLSDTQREALAIGHTRSLADWLSRPVASQPVLPPAIVYLDQNGAPFT